MGWKEGDRVSERREFCRLRESGDLTMSELCRRFGVSRKTGYKWLSRRDEHGDEGLNDQSRRPHRSPGKTSDSIESEVVALRRQHPAWGGRKLRHVLLSRGVENVPSPSSITRILHRHGLINPSDSEKHRPFERFEMEFPNELWQIDFKGDFGLAGGGRCYPLTILDDCSRYSLGVFACDNQRGVTVRHHFREVFHRYGIPRAIYVDNGTPWGTSLKRTRHTRVSTWLMRQDIQVIHGRPYHPQGRGKIERFHRTLKQEVLQDRQLEDVEEAQSAFDPWRDCYNQERPHESLGMAVPASVYRPSIRRFEEVAIEYEYSDRFEVRRTNKTGQFSFQKTSYRIGDAFTEQPIGLSPTCTDGLWDVYYCRFCIAQLDQRTGHITYDRRLAASRSARYGQTAK